MKPYSAARGKEKRLCLQKPENKAVLYIQSDKPDVFFWLYDASGFARSKSAIVHFSG